MGFRFDFILNSSKLFLNPCHANFDINRRAAIFASMKLYSFEVTQNVSASLQNVWSFFSNVNNLAKITPPSLGFESHHLGKEEVHSGMIITHCVSPFPYLPWIRMNWVTEISHVNPPFLFVDEQRFGPYRFWHHQHHFRETPQGTEMIDRIHYALSFDPFSRLANTLLVERSLKEIFQYREKAVESIFKSGF